MVLTSYGIIALGRGAVTTPILPRYHYVGQLCLVLLLSAILSTAADRIPAPVIGALMTLWVGVLVAAYLLWSTPLDDHAEARAGTAQAIRDIRSAILTAPPAAPVFIANRVFAPFPYLPTLFPGWAAVFAIFFPRNVVDGHRVYFVTSNPLVIDALRSRVRTGTLVVP